MSNTNNQRPTVAQLQAYYHAQDCTIHLTQAEAEAVIERNWPAPLPKWKRLDAGFYESPCGRFTAETEKRRTDGATTESSWCLMQRTDDGDGYCNHFNTLKEAKAATIEIIA